MMPRILLPVFILKSLLLSSIHADDAATLTFKPDKADHTLSVRDALEGAQSRHLVLVFEKGRYFFGRDNAAERYLAITNHDNGLKRVIFSLERFDSITIEGNGSEFIFNGQVLPFLFQECGAVDVSNLTIDWDIPFYFQATVNEVHTTNGTLDITPFTHGFSWSVQRGQLIFPDIDGFTYSSPGETLPFDPTNKRVAHGAWDMHLNPEKVEELETGQLRVHADLRHPPAVGTVIVAKGKMGENRYAPAFYALSSKNIRMEDVTIHHALGMGFLFERCDTVTLTDCAVQVRPESDRLVSVLADATHFCNTKGEILIENCRFQHMLDDGTNVHGTYVVVHEIVSPRQVKVRLMHFQQTGYVFAEKGDQIWLIRHPNPSRNTVTTVEDFRPLNERFSLITFEEPLSSPLSPGDLLENKTWNPSFTMRGCTISDHRARGIVLKTPLPIVIENNYFSSMMSSIFFRGESAFWYESGAVRDVLIQNNVFNYCAYSGMEHAILRVTPRLGKLFDDSQPFDRNIRFVDNLIQTFGNRIVWADRVEGLQFLQNTIIQTKDAANFLPAAPIIELTNCRNTQIIGNSYSGNNQNGIVADAISQATLIVQDNEGLLEE